MLQRQYLAAYSSVSWSSTYEQYTPIVGISFITPMTSHTTSYDGIAWSAHQTTSSSELRLGVQMGIVPGQLPNGHVTFYSYQPMFDFELALGSYLIDQPKKLVSSNTTQLHAVMDPLSTPNPQSTQSKWLSPLVLGSKDSTTTKCTFLDFANLAPKAHFFLNQIQLYAQILATQQC